MFYILYFVLGTIMGSFYLVYGTRAPKGENFLNSRSKCDECGHLLKWYLLIPLLSYACLLGKCHYCRKKININHFIVELITGVLFLVGFIIYGNSIEFIKYLIIISTLLVIFISDFKYMIILDSTIITSSILYLIVLLVTEDLKTVFLHILSGIILFGVMYLISRLGEKLYKREALGGGDIKLCFLIGLVINFELGLVALILSTFLALPYAFATLMLNKKNELPYGPFLIAALFIIFLFQDKFLAVLEIFRFF